MCGVALTSPKEPMLAEARRQLPQDEALPRDSVAEQKPDGFRAVLFARPGLVMLQSCQGADLTGAFPDIAAAATELGEALVLDGELVMPYEGRLHFGELQRRARRRGRGAVQAAAERPAYLIVFDVLETGAPSCSPGPTASGARSWRTSSPATSPPRSRCAPPLASGRPHWTGWTRPGARLASRVS